MSLSKFQFLSQFLRGRTVPVFTTLYAEGEFDLTCSSGQTEFAVILPNRDRVMIYCPVSGQASIHRIDNITLPATLPVGYTSASAFDLGITQNEEEISVITEGGYIKASFIAPAIQPGKSYAVLYWDEQTMNWIVLKDFIQGMNFNLIPEDPYNRMILSGVNSANRWGLERIEISTNFPGIFVLAQH